VDRFSAECFAQGDKERELGLTPSTYHDRFAAAASQSQLAVAIFIAAPLFERFAQVAPNARDLYEAPLHSNVRFWQQEDWCRRRAPRVHGTIVLSEVAAECGISTRKHPFGSRFLTASSSSAAGRAGGGSAAAPLVASSPPSVLGGSDRALTLVRGDPSAPSRVAVPSPGAGGMELPGMANSSPPVSPSSHVSGGSGGSGTSTGAATAKANKAANKAATTEAPAPAARVPSASGSARVMGTTKAHSSVAELLDVAEFVLRPRRANTKGWYVPVAAKKSPVPATSSGDSGGSGGSGGEGDSGGEDTDSKRHGTPEKGGSDKGDSGEEEDEEGEHEEEEPQQGAWPEEPFIVLRLPGRGVGTMPGRGHDARAQVTRLSLVPSEIMALPQHDDEEDDTKEHAAALLHSMSAPASAAKKHAATPRELVRQSSQGSGSVQTAIQLRAALCAQLRFSFEHAFL